MPSMSSAGRVSAYHNLHRAPDSEEKASIDRALHLLCEVIHKRFSICFTKLVAYRAHVSTTSVPRNFVTFGAKSVGIKTNMKCVKA